MMMESIWTDNGVPSVSHFIVAIYFAFAFVAARFILDRFIFSSVASWLLSRGTTQLKQNEETRAKIVKCSESLWKLMYYGTIEFCTLAAIYQEPWFLDVKEYFTGWPDQELKLSIKLVYMCELHNIENELEDPSTIKLVIRTSLALCSITYILTSFFGFLLFGDSTLDDVLSNFDKNLGIPFSSQLNDAVRVSYALHLMLVFPIIFFPLRLNLDDLLFPSSVPLANDNVRFGPLTVGIVCVVFLGANFIPSIWDAFQFTGATSAVCLGFIFPAAIALRQYTPWKTKSNTSLVAIYSDAYTIFKKNVSPSPE